jgi:hemolysin activation/secretion protein
LRLAISPRGHRRVLTVVATVCALLASAASLAQSAGAVAQVAVPSSFAIRGFNIRGDNPLSQNETGKVLAPFLRADATREVLQEASAALEAALRVAGFGSHRVAVPPQEAGDIVLLDVLKLTIGRVAIQGNQRTSVANVRASLPELKEGASPNFSHLAVQTAMANDNPGRQVAVAFAESGRPGIIDAAVEVKESKPWEVSLALSNAGSLPSGRDRTALSGSHHNLWDRDHQLAAAYATSVDKPSHAQQWGLSYRIPLYSLHGVVGLSVTQSDVVGSFGTFASTGPGRTLGANYVFYLSPEGGRRSFVTLAYDNKLFKAGAIHGSAMGLDRRSTPVSLGYTLRSESHTSAWSTNADFAFNTGAGAGNNLQAYQAEDPRITTRSFKILHAGASYATELGQKWRLGMRAQLQFSPNALIAGEQFGLGGVSSVRGATDRVLVGDRGLSTSLEVTSPDWMPGLRTSCFVDAGWLNNNDANGSAKLSSEKLASVGLGLRYAAQNGFLVSADYGRIVSGSALPLASNASAPQKGSDKLHMNLSIRF